MGSPYPELVDTLFVTVFSRNFQGDNLALREQIKDMQAGISALREFATVDENSFPPLWGERVKVSWLLLANSFMQYQ